MNLAKLYNDAKAYLNAHPMLKAFLITVESAAVTFITTSGASYFITGSIFTKAGMGSFVAAFMAAESVAIKNWFRNPPPVSNG